MLVTRWAPIRAGVETGIPGRLDRIPGDLFHDQRGCHTTPPIFCLARCAMEANRLATRPLDGPLIPDARHLDARLGFSMSDARHFDARRDSCHFGTRDSF
jgi:hypothetical protein